MFILVLESVYNNVQLTLQILQLTVTVQNRNLTGIVRTYLIYQTKSKEKASVNVQVKKEHRGLSVVDTAVTF